MSDSQINPDDRDTDAVSQNYPPPDPSLSKRAQALYDLFASYQEKGMSCAEVPGPQPIRFHTLTYYFGAYIIAWRKYNEPVLNHLMDLIRGHYRRAGITATPFRLETIYTYTGPWNKMRKFLIQSALERLWDGIVEADAMKGSDYEPKCWSYAMKGVMDRNPYMGAHFDQEAKTFRTRMKSTEGKDCRWHEHCKTQVCQGFKPDW